MTSRIKTISSSRNQSQKSESGAKKVDERAQMIKNLASLNLLLNNKDKVVVGDDGKQMTFSGMMQRINHEKDRRKGTGKVVAENNVLEDTFE